LKVNHIHNEEDQLWLNQLTKKVNEIVNIEKPKWIYYVCLKFIFYFGGSAFFYFLLFFAQSSIIFLVSYVLFGLLAFLFALNFAHDCAHESLFKSRFLNGSVFSFLFSMLGADAGAWRVRHITAHHFAPNVAGYDSDLSVTILFRISPDCPYRNYHKWQFIYAPILYSTYSFFWIFLKDFTLLFREFKSRKSIEIVVFFLTKTLYFVFSLGLPLLFSHQSIRIVILGYLLMHLTQSLFLLFTFLISHHVEKTHYPKVDESKEIQASWIQNQILSSNDVSPFSWAANFIFGGFNNHIAHHLFPTIHHFYYRKMNEVIYEAIIEKGIETSRTTFISGIISHIRLLWHLGRRQQA
jgi:linoleoyl-CoA desaturase